MTVRMINVAAGGWAIADSTYAMWYGLAIHPIVISIIGVALVWNAMAVPHRTDLF